MDQQLTAEAVPHALYFTHSARPTTALRALASLYAKLHQHAPGDSALLIIPSVGHTTEAAFVCDPYPPLDKLRALGEASAAPGRGHVEERVHKSLL